MSPLYELLQLCDVPFVLMQPRHKSGPAKLEEKIRLKNCEIGLCLLDARILMVLFLKRHVIVKRLVQNPHPHPLTSAHILRRSETVKSISRRNKQLILASGPNIYGLNKKEVRGESGKGAVA